MCQVADMEMSALHHHELYIYIYIYMHYRVALKRLKRPLYRISNNSTSLFVHYCKGVVLEYLPGLVDFTIKLNLNDKQRGELRKLQHFLGNRMSRDILILVLGDTIELMLGCSIGSKYLGSSLDASLYESYTGSPKL